MSGQEARALVAEDQLMLSVLKIIRDSTDPGRALDYAIQLAKEILAEEAATVNLQHS